jgi:hypothetical protein
MLARSAVVTTARVGEGSNVSVGAFAFTVLMIESPDRVEQAEWLFDHARGLAGRVYALAVLHEWDPDLYHVRKEGLDRDARVMTVSGSAASWQTIRQLTATIENENDPLYLRLMITNECVPTVLARAKTTDRAGGERSETVPFRLVLVAAPFPYHFPGSPWAALVTEETAPGAERQPAPPSPSVTSSSNDVGCVIAAYFRFGCSYRIRGPLTVDQLVEESALNQKATHPADTSTTEFRYPRRRWTRLRREMQPGDLLFFFESDDLSWRELRGRRGYAVVRDGVVVKVILTELN